MLRRGSPLDPRSENGQSITLFAVFLPLILVILALVVDGSLAFVQKQKMQNAADAAALAVALDVTGTACNNCAQDAAKYLSLNDVTLQPNQTALPLCSQGSPPCYTWPYVDSKGTHKDEVQIKASSGYHNFFGQMLSLVGIFDPKAASATAVGGLGPGNAPPVSFAALNSSCDNHTLVIRSGGILTVGSNIYVNSCNAPKDAFDLFGSGGEIHAPGIVVHGGWETHDGTTVWVGGSKCGLADSQSYYPTTPTPSGCPKVDQPPLVDPFAGAVFAPPLAATGASSCTLAAPCYNTVEYPTAQYSTGDVGIGDGTITVRGSLIAKGDYISVGGERMLVSKPPTTNSDGTETVTVTRGTSTTPVLGTVAAAHTVPQVSIAGELRVDGVATLTTSTPHGLSIGDQVVVNIPGDPDSFDGVHTVTDIPDEDDSQPDEFSFTDGQSSKANVGSVSLVGVSRTSGIDMIETSAPHGLNVGDPVSVQIKTGDTSFAADAEDHVTVLSVPSPTTFTYLDPNAGTSQAGADVSGGSATITSVSRIANVASITVSGDPGVSTGALVNVTFAPDSSFNATLATALSATTTTSGPPRNPTITTTITYANTGPNVRPAVIASGGTKVTSASRASGVATLTVSSLSSSIAIPGYVAVQVSDSSFDGIFPITAYVSNGSSSTISYADPGPDVASEPLGASTDLYKAALPLSSITQTNGNATAVSTNSNSLAVGQDVVIGTGDASLDGTFQITSVTAATKTFTYTNPNQLTDSTATGGFARVTAGASVAGSNCTAGQCTLANVFSAATGNAIGPAKDVTSLNGTVAGPLFEVFQIPNSTPISGGTPTSPAEYDVPSGSPATVLYPGTYYGGICIGNPTGVHCGPNVGGTCSTSSTTGPTVLLNPGVYVMAGGGFYICGKASVTGTNVMIYNTVDSASSSTAAALAQVEFDTNGNVTLSPPLTDDYAGLTIYQGADPASSSSSPPNLQISTSKCDGRQGKLTDIDLIHTANGLNGISGTIYAPANYALFADSLSGTANLAVLAGCIFIDGADSTFNFSTSSGLFGRAPGLLH